MNKFRPFSVIVIFSSFILLVSIQAAVSQLFTYRGSWGTPGISVQSLNENSISLNFSITEFSLEDFRADETILKQVMLPGHFMHNEAGAPDLPGKTYFIALPTGASVQLIISDFRTDTIEGVDIVPAPVIPVDISQEPLVYEQNPLIYSADQFYPAEPVTVSGITQMRGVDVALIGIMPFRYNPVKKQLIVYRDLKADISFIGGNGQFGDNRYRTRYWDPVLYDRILNSISLKPVSYHRNNHNGSRTLTGCEYLIITPDGEAFQQWADSIRKFRTEQGILTDVVTITEVGGNTASAIESYITNAYNNWDIPPDACLLLADYGSDPSNSIISDVLNDHPGGYNPYITDNLFADVTGGDLLPEVAFARITARNETELQLMVKKFLDYERNPPINPDFYDNPITALGWQTERWFQLCSETVGGYFKNELGKDPVRINEIYDGDPDTDPWSTATNTTTILNYFGPSGTGYIPSSPTTLGNWTGGTAAMINNAINSGSFLLQHRDHGYTQGWGEPVYNTSHISNLTNSDLTFVLSINCQTGKFDAATECLAEKFHRHSYGGQGSGALGVIAPTEVSYSFVNDTYTWGLYDNMWTDFLPDMVSSPASRGLLPCFGNAAGKYYLQQSTWPASSQSIKNITYKIFHFHGDAFSSLYSEVPQSLAIAHDPVLFTGVSSFTVTADPGAFIALVIGDEILGTADGTGSPVAIPIPGLQIPGQEMIVTVTKTNYFRYRSVVNILPMDGPYVILFDDPVVDDSAWNNNGMADYGEVLFLSLPMKNMGDEGAEMVQVIISSDDPYVEISDSTESYGTITAGGLKTIDDGFCIQVSDSVPDNHNIVFEVTSVSDTNEWNSTFTLTAHAPQLSSVQVGVQEVSGNLNGIFDPGETAGFSVSVYNGGSGPVGDLSVILDCSDALISIPDPEEYYGFIGTGDTVTHTFQVVADPLALSATSYEYHLFMTDEFGREYTDTFSVMLGRLPVLIIDLDPNTSSGPAIQAAVAANGVDSDYSTTFPSDLDICSSLFVCLGIYSSNHVLTPAEGQLLADYLAGGGCLYMEGGDTWAFDAATAVHPMFQIDGLSDGSNDLVTITGVTGAYTQGLSYTYSGDESWIDRLGPLSTAFITLNNSSPSYATGISFDGGTYKTIGCSHEFGGLTNGTYTRTQLMRSYLGFFGIPVQAEWLGVTNDWHSPSNWSNGMVPDQNTITIIPASLNYPTVFSGGTATCRGVRIEPGVNLVLPAGAILNIQKD